MKRCKENPNNHSTKPKYHPDMVEQVCNMAKLGLTEKQMADVLLISVKTLEDYKRKYPEFTDALNKGRIEADAKVAAALYHRAIGYSHPDVYITVQRGEVFKVPYTKHYAPDVGAMAFWLKNRTRGFDQPWVDALKHELTGKDGGPIDINKIDKLDLSDVSTEELELLKQIAPKIFDKIEKK